MNISKKVTYSITGSAPNYELVDQTDNIDYEHRPRLGIRQDVLDAIEQDASFTLNDWLKLTPAERLEYYLGNLNCWFPYRAEGQLIKGSFSNYCICGESIVKNIKIINNKTDKIAVVGSVCQSHFIKTRCVVCDKLCKSRKFNVCKEHIKSVTKVYNCDRCKTQVFDKKGPRETIIYHDCQGDGLNLHCLSCENPLRKDEIASGHCSMCKKCMRCNHYYKNWKTHTQECGSLQDAYYKKWPHLIRKY